MKDYRRARAVDGVDLVVHAGERVALARPERRGQDHDAADDPRRRQPRRGIGDDRRLPAREEAQPAPRRTSGSRPATSRSPSACACASTCSCTGSSTASPIRHRRSRRASQRFRVEHLADAMGTELSSGQRTLIGIVRATLHRPRLLVLDEPTASLDPDVALRVRTGLLELCARDGCALLMTSHDMSDVEQVCERVVFLSQGRVVADAHAARGRGAVRARRPRRRVPPTRRPARTDRRRSRAITRERTGPDRSGGGRCSCTARPRRRCGSARSRAGTRTCWCAARTACSTSRCGRSSTCCCSARSPRSSATATVRRVAGRGLPARRHRALARHLPVADRAEHGLPRGDVDPQPAEHDGDAGARGRVRRGRRAVRHGEARAWASA